MTHWLIALTLCLTPSLAVASLDECYDATCRLHLAGHSGSGCVFAEDATHYYVLTNAHVTRKNDQPRLVFVIDGHERSVNGETVWHDFAPIEQGYHRDIAVVKVEKGQFSGHTPSIVPIAEQSFALAENQEIASSGAPGGGYITSWKGHAVSVSTDAFNFVPPPMGGRSGSAIFDHDGTKIIGLLAWGGGGEGTAQSIGEIHRAMRGEAAQKYPQARDAATHLVAYTPPLAPLADIDPRQAPCPDCLPQQPSPIRPPARPPSQPPGDGGGMPFPLPPGITPEPDAPEPQPPPSNPAPVQPAPTPTQPPVKGCECDGSGKCQCKPEDQCLCDGKDVAALQARITILEAQIAAICQQIEPSKLAPQIEPHLKPFRIRVVPPSGYTDTEPPYSAVRLGQRVDLKLEPVPKAQ